jgi:hypothetical protein
MSAMSDYLEVEVRKAMFRTTTVSVRANSTAYSVGDRVMLGTSNLNVYECITAGTSAASAPSFNTTLGSTTTDGTVTWLTLGQGMPKRPIYIALYTTAPTDAGGGTEVSGGAYARQQVDPSDSNWSAPDNTGGLTDNVNNITFPVATANWGTIVAVGIFDRASGGNLLLWGNLAANKTINSGDQFIFPAGNLDITFA